MKALIIVDLQNDFMPGGALAIDQADAIIPLVNALVHGPFDTIIATKDWHQPGHGSFASSHLKKPGDHIQLAGIDQILWPDHCVQGTLGSEFAPGWNSKAVDKIIFKGTEPLIDSYSTFFDNEHLKSTGLDILLKEKGVKDLFFAGLATDYCVKYSVIDALQLGFNVYVIVDACKGVNLKAKDSEKALKLMKKKGAKLITFKDLPNLWNLKSCHLSP